MQHIGIEKINERGETLQRSDVNFVDIIVNLYKVNDYKEKFPLLSYIDPYGDTYFNMLQKQDLIRELENFNFDKNLTNKVINFIKNAKDLEYIKFIGD